MPTAQLPGLKVNFVQLPARAAAGSGEDFVMVHGLATNLAFWYAGLSQGFTHFGRVTLYDLRGHGRSEMSPSGYAPAALAADLGTLLDYLGLERVHIIAHSFGGSVALSYALMHPERIKSLILADVRIPCVQKQLVFAQWPLWALWRKRLRDASIEIDENHPESGIQLLIALARLQVQQGTKPAQAQKLLGELGRLGGRRAAMRWLQLIETTAAYRETVSGVEFSPEDLGRLTQPVLALVGEHTFTMASALALKRHCRQCQVEVVPKAGHFFPISRPLDFLGRCHRFLKTHVADGAFLDLGPLGSGPAGSGSLIESSPS